jgi:hypothetical protein
VLPWHTEVAEHLLSLDLSDPLRQSEVMVHLLGSDDWARAAQFYGAPGLSDAELKGATQVLADTILTQGRGIDRVLRLLGTAGGAPD